MANTNLHHQLTTQTGIEAPEEEERAQEEEDGVVVVNQECKDTHDDAKNQSKMIVSFAEAMNPSRRTTMEDRYVCSAPGTWGAMDKELTFIGVYDGHGGREMVDFLEFGLTHHVAQELNATDDDSRMKVRLERAFLMTDIHSRLAGVMTSGAAVALCLIKRSREQPQVVHITTANAGDSRIVLFHDEQVSRLTHDHRCDDPLEIARIQGAGGFLHRGRVLGVLALTRSLGDHMLKPFVIAHPHIEERTLDLLKDIPPPTMSDEPDDPVDENENHATRSAEIPSSSSFLILACDGLWDVMTDEDAVKLVRGHDGEREDVAKLLVQESLRRGTADNVTAVVVWL